MQTLFPPGMQRVVFPRGELHAYADRLLQDTGAAPQLEAGNLNSSDPDRWQSCGLAELTGFPDQPLEHCPLPLADYADATLEAFKALSGKDLPLEIMGADLLTLRARMTGLSRQGPVSPGGSCRILATYDGHLAVNLARDNDWNLLEAWLMEPVSANWQAVGDHLRRRNTAELVERGRLLGMAICDVQPEPPEARKWFDIHHRTEPVESRHRPARVVDLSSLWAGPLCSQLLHWAGAEVIKVESRQRPDGARSGSAEFFEFLNSGKEHLQLDLHTNDGQEELRQLIRSADILIEGSRPRALRQMNIVAESMLDECPGLTWVGISGYGRREPMANWIAYGDDAGVAAGLSALLHETTGEYMICGDAIADPLTGMHAALAAIASWHAGGGHLLSLSLVQTVQHCIQFYGAEKK